MKKYVGRVILLVVGILVAAGVFAGSTFWANQELNRQAGSRQTTTEPAIQSQGVTFTYQGEAGKDALTIIKEKATVEQNASGLVTAINGRKADDAKKEFWAFYVNGQMAQVGPAEYQTKTGDIIEWKIETY